tara:strand:+ start:1463 stop:1630 length:168 start_codon:yes stop_codon:yes gene_type:complete
MSREYTNKLLDLIDEGITTDGIILSEMLKWFTEDQIKRFCLEGFAGEMSEHFKDL